MPKAGQVRVELTRRMAAETAAWLSNIYVPPRPSLIGGTTAADQRLQIERAEYLAAILQKSARRRRSGEAFVCLIDRDLVRWLGTKWDGLAITRGVLAADNDAGFVVVPFNVQRVISKFRIAATTRRGRPKLKKSEMEHREGRGMELDERHRKRVARRARFERRLDTWVREGKTLLGSGLDDYPTF